MWASWGDQGWEACTSLTPPHMSVSALALTSLTIVSLVILGFIEEFWLKKRVVIFRHVTG